LEKRFQTQHYLTAGERIHFARQLNLSVLQVNIIIAITMEIIKTKFSQHALGKDLVPEPSHEIQENLA